LAEKKVGVWEEKSLSGRGRPEKKNPAVLLGKKRNMLSIRCRLPGTSALTFLQEPVAI